MTSARGRAEERPERANCLVGPRRRFRGRSRPFGLVNKQSRLSRSASFDRNCLRRRATPSSPVPSTPRWLGPDRASLCISSPQCAPDIASEWGGWRGSALQNRPIRMRAAERSPRRSYVGFRALCLREDEAGGQAGAVDSPGGGVEGPRRACPRALLVRRARGPRRRWPVDFLPCFYCGREPRFMFTVCPYLWPGIF